MKRIINITNKNFNDYTYSKKTHVKLFNRFNYSHKLHHKHMSFSFSRLKHYQDLLVFAFITQNIPKGSRLLEVGGGDSRLLKYFCHNYECWNIDKLEGIGNGPKRIGPIKYHLVRDYMGNFNKDLPDDYFDIVFSVSALEHVPIDSVSLFRNILQDINRVVKPGAYSLHCFDVIAKKNNVWSNPLLTYLFEKTETCNEFVPFEQMIEDPDLFGLSKIMYYLFWMHRTKKSYSAFGKPVSYNILWKKV